MVLVRSMFRLLTFLLACAVPAAAWGQPWLDAYKAGKHRQALDLLYEHVSHPEQLFPGNPEALRLLAEMHREGVGVQPDPVGACSLAQDAEEAIRMNPAGRPLSTITDARAYEARQKEAEDFTSAVCGLLSPADRVSAARSRGGCYGLGMPEATIAVGSHSVRVSRSGVVPAGTPDRDMGGLPMCPLAVALVRSRTIDPPEDAPSYLGPRHFIEVFAWRRNHVEPQTDGTFALGWLLFEVRSNEVMPVATEMVLASSSITGGLPPDVGGRITFQMVRSGHVLWRVAGAPPKRGWIMVAEVR